MTSSNLIPIIEQEMHLWKFSSLLISTFSKKKKKIYGLLCYRTSEELSIDVPITNVGVSRTDIDEVRVISFLGVRTDRQTLFRNPCIGNLSTHKKFHFKAQNWELAVNRNMHPRMTTIHNCLFVFQSLWLKPQNMQCSKLSQIINEWIFSTQNPTVV